MSALVISVIFFILGCAAAIDTSFKGKGALQVVGRILYVYLFFAASGFALWTAQLPWTFAAAVVIQVIGVAIIIFEYVRDVLRF